MKWVFHSSSMHLGKNGKPGWRHRFAADALYPGRNGFDGIQSMSNSICKGKICKYSRIWSPSPSSANALDKTSWRALWWLLIIGEFYIKIEITFKNSFSGFLFFCLLPWGVVGALLVASQLVGSCSQTRDQTCIPYIGRWILNCWATREVPCYLTPLVLFHISQLKYHTLLSFKMNFPELRRQESPFCGRSLHLTLGLLLHPGHPGRGERPTSQLAASVSQA